MPSRVKSVVNNAWLLNRKPNPKARLRLFCFPYEGGGTSIFRVWSDLLPANVEVWSIQLPGRGSRLSESPFTQVQDLTPVLSSAIKPVTNKPFAFFGHGMGALISFEVARQMQQSSGGSPAHLFVAGQRAPNIVNQNPPIHNLPEAELIATLQSLGDAPREELENPELRQLLVPPLRADWELSETYEYREEPPLAVPISVYGGLADANCSFEEMKGWASQTSAGFALQMFPGNHFFLQTCQAEVLGVVAQTLNEIQKPRIRRS